MKFTERGGRVTVTAAAEDSGILVTASRTPASASAPRTCRRSAGRSSRRKGAYDRRHDGTGLGLSIVQGLVALHGGEFDIASRVGQGTTRFRASAVELRDRAACRASRRMSRARRSTARKDRLKTVKNRRRRRRSFNQENCVRVPCQQGQQEQTTRISAAALPCGCRSRCAGCCCGRATRLPWSRPAALSSPSWSTRCSCNRGRIPAPIFANKPVPVVAPQPDPLASIMPHRRPAAVSKPEVVTATRPRSDTVLEIQRELTRRGFYDGPADGFYGPKTDAAIRDFEQAAGLRASAEPGETLLAAIARSSVKAKPVETPRDPIAALLAPSGRIIAVQRALIEFGYGPLAANGTYDAADPRRDRALRARAQAPGDRPDHRPTCARPRRP